MKRVLILVLCFTVLVGLSAAFAYSFPRWKTMPLHVYVPQNQGVYTKLMYQAFNAWQTKSNGLVRFKYISRPSDADIFVEFVEVSEPDSSSYIFPSHYSFGYSGHWCFHTNCKIFLFEFSEKCHW